MCYNAARPLLTKGPPTTSIYTQKYSQLRDIQILLRRFLVAVTGQGAY
jgi:hypothetical protein